MKTKKKKLRSRHCQLSHDNIQSPDLLKCQFTALSFFHNRCCKTCDFKRQKKKGVVSPTMLVEFLHNPVSYDYS